MGLCALGLAGIAAMRHSQPPPDTARSAPLSISSRTEGAEVRLDGGPVGRTTLSLLTTPGTHTIALHRRDSLTSTQMARRYEVWVRQKRAAAPMPGLASVKKGKKR